MQPTTKQSLTLAHSVVTPRLVRNCSGELAFALKPQDPAFLKFEVKQQNLFELLPGKINLVTELSGGLIFGRTYQNDRFFFYNLLGYLYTGHIEPSVSVRVEQVPAEGAVVVLGDDLGVNKFLYVNARLDYLNVPFVRDIGARLFSVAELGLYPKENGALKGSVGFGVNLPIN